MAKYYTGVGSRETPDFICEAMQQIAFIAEWDGYTLRSGGADGADKAFESGAIHLKDIYLPWKGFNRNESKLFEVGQDAIDLAMTIHPAPDRLKDAAKRLHGRNCYQVLGADLNTPSDFVVAWTPEIIPSGGTRTAIVLAERHGIPILNLSKCKGKHAAIEAFRTFLMLYG